MAAIFYSVLIRNTNPAELEKLGAITTPTKESTVYPSPYDAVIGEILHNEPNAPLLLVVPRTYIQDIPISNRDNSCALKSHIVVEFNNLFEACKPKEDVLFGTKTASYPARVIDAIATVVLLYKRGWVLIRTRQDYTCDSILDDRRRLHNMANNSSGDKCRDYPSAREIIDSMLSKDRSTIYTFVVRNSSKLGVYTLSYGFQSGYTLLRYSSGTDYVDVLKHIDVPTNKDVIDALAGKGFNVDDPNTIITLPWKYLVSILSRPECVNKVNPYNVVLEYTEMLVFGLPTTEDLTIQDKNVAEIVAFSSQASPYLIYRETTRKQLLLLLGGVQDNLGSKTTRTAIAY